MYKLCTTHIEKTFVKYDSINKASKGTGPSRDSIQRYLNTNVPIKGFLFYTSPPPLTLAQGEGGEPCPQQGVDKSPPLYFFFIIFITPCRSILVTQGWIGQSLYLKESEGRADKNNYKKNKGVV